MSTASLEEQKIGPATLWFSAARGRYPEGNSLLVEGSQESVLIDPSLGCIGREAQLAGIDRVLLSHCHEDHIAGLHLLPDRPVHLHRLDRPGLDDLDSMMAIYGMTGDIETGFRHAIETRFHYVARPDAEAFEDGAIFDLGGGVRIEILHTPGHTRGHCCPLISSAAGRVLYLGDIDLTGFGPYYGDAWSDLEDFERSLARVRDVEADWYATFHHIGAVDRETFLARLDKYTSVIASRESRLLEYLAEPRTLPQIIEHRFVYRPGDAVAFADAVEARSMTQHLTRLVTTGQAKELPPNTWQAI